jgi:hypothetical protein
MTWMLGLGHVHVHLGRRSGHVSIYDKRNKYREVPLNSTARDALTSYLQTLPDGAAYLFPSRKRADSTAGVGPVGERALIYIVSKYNTPSRRACATCHRTIYGTASATVWLRPYRSTAWLNSWARLVGHDAAVRARHPAGPPASRRDDFVALAGEGL